MPYTHTNTPGYTDIGLRTLAKAHSIIIKDRGLDMDCLPAAVAQEINQTIRDRLLSTHSRNLSVRKLLAVFEG